MARVVLTECMLPAQALGAISQLLLGTSSSSHDRLLESCSISSDSFGSLPVFDAEGQLVKYEVCSSPIYLLSQRNCWDVMSLRPEVLYKAHCLMLQFPTPRDT